MAPLNRLARFNGKKPVSTQLTPEDTTELLRLKQITEEAVIDAQEYNAKAQLAQVHLNRHVAKLQRKYGLTLGDEVSPDGSVTKAKVG